MRRCIFSFFCVFALASCSPKVYSGVRETRAFQIAAASDSVRVASLVDARMEAYFGHYLERAAELRQETVREAFSEPDSAGKQYVTERSTTRSVASSQMSAGSFAQQSGRTVTQTDSVAVRDSSAVLEIQESVEETKGAPQKRGWGNFFVYLIGLIAAVLLGLIIGVYCDRRITENW